MPPETGIAIRNGTAAAARGGALDLLRFVAALLIVVYHYSAEGPRPLEAMHPVFLRGYLATDFFLVFSGYVLGRAYGPPLAAGRLSAGDFFIKRALRVWPGHLAMLGLFVTALLGASLVGVAPHHPERFVWGALPMQVFLVQAWGAPGGGGWNLPTWSLSALLVCYAIFPYLWRGLGRMARGAALLLLGLMGVVLADALAIHFLGRTLYDLPFHVGAARAAPLFFLGACLARAVELAWPPERAARWIGICAGAAFIALQAIGRHDFLSVTLIALVVLAAGRTPVRRPSGLVSFGARLSFSLFLSHVFSGMVWFAAVRALEAHLPVDEAARWGLWGLSFPVALTGAWLFDRFVDGPLQAAIKAVRARPGRYPAPARSG